MKLTQEEKDSLKVLEASIKFMELKIQYNKKYVHENNPFPFCFICYRSNKRLRKWKDKLRFLKGGGTK